jgi:hypothetical protein
MSDIVLYGLGGLMFYQAYVTIRVARSKSHTSAQKRRHFLFIWLVPFIGAAIALGDLATDKKSPVRPDKDSVSQKPKNRG